MRVLAIPPPLMGQLAFVKDDAVLIQRGQVDAPNVRKHKCFYFLHPTQRGRVYHITGVSIDNRSGTLTLKLGNSFVTNAVVDLSSSPPAYQYIPLNELGLMQIGPGLLVAAAPNDARKADDDTCSTGTV